ncbi:NADP-dependent oxidoreductase [Actinomadura logoneensis]|uniref:NADP-dependent oxidoreductase n=1 Tax=Actinomadura logoneensis TaxID=2293572 RepID=A0A372JJ16_9ACTN|nr:NADP-dependent oxidoreductase [Actinomadura logoneensis]RFU40011.1 NADP-dependent oxidoreductase [Actinomadura logoneensis]
METPAMAVETFGPPENLKPVRLPVAKPGPDEVVVKVTAAAVNPADLGMREGRYPWADEPRLPLVPGYDLAGTVEAGTPEWPSGTKVIAITAHKETQIGAYAEYVTLPARLLAPAPDGMDAEHASALPLAGLTAFEALSALDLAPGATLLVNGPRGAVGSLTVQLAEHRGITVVANGGGPVDAALDTVGGERAQAAFDAVRDGGRYVTVVPEFWIPGGPFTEARGIEPRVIGARFDTVRLRELSRLASEGVLSTAVGDRLPLTEAAAAHARLAAGGVHGKLILIP